MTEYTGAWDREGVAAFLSEARIPIRLACRTPSGLWMLSLWYGFDADAERFVCATAADADVVRHLREDDAVAFEVSTNDPPYRGVRGRGRATIVPAEGKAVLRDLLSRYLGGTDSSLARRLLSPDREEVTVRIDPERVYSWDFSDRMADVSVARD